MSRKPLIAILAPLLLATTPVAAQPASEEDLAAEAPGPAEAAPEPAETAPAPQEAPPEYAPPKPGTAETSTPPPIPPNAEGTPVQASGGGYCYGGPHPVDTRYAPGPTWDATPGPHTRPYPPIDLRLFAFKDGCYYFIGDPLDFGYAGQTYAYYGAHPILDAHGGGWCFMIGPHTHFWRPWSPHFVTVGSWYYWEGPYDAYFWSYWPYYSFYYRDYYPHYYRGGYFYRHHHGFRVAPPITRVPPPSWHGGWRGRPAGSAAAPGGWRGAPASPAARPGTPFHAPAAGDGWRGSPAPSAAPAPNMNTGRGGWRGGPAPSAPSRWGGSPSRAPSPVRSGGGWRRR